MRLHRIAATAAVAALLAGCASSGAATTGPTQAGATTPPVSAAPTATPIAPPTSLIAAGKLEDCVDIEYPPMEYFPSTDITDANASVGFDVDAARAVAGKLGLTIDVRNTAFDALIPDLQAARCDIVWSALYVSDKRLAVADAAPYMSTGHVIMVPA